MEFAHGHEHKGRQSHRAPACSQAGLCLPGRVHSGSLDSVLGFLSLSCSLMWQVRTNSAQPPSRCLAKIFSTDKHSAPGEEGTKGRNKVGRDQALASTQEVTAQEGQVLGQEGRPDPLHRGSAHPSASLERFLKST